MDEWEARKALDNAIFDSDIDLLKKLIDQGVDINEPKPFDEDDQSPLHRSMSNSNISPEIGIYLIKRGADIEQVNLWGTNSVIYAIREVAQGNTSIMTEMLKQDLNINKLWKITSGGTDSLTYLHKILEYIEEGGKYKNELLEIFYLFIKKGADITIKNSNDLSIKEHADRLGITIPGMPRK